MVRARSGKTVIRRRKRLMKLTKGFRLGRHNLVKQAKITLARAGVFALRDRRVRKRMFRRLWIQRLNAAVRSFGLSYSRLVEGLIAASIGLDRKVLSDMAIRDPDAFKVVVEQAKAALTSKHAKTGTIG